MSSSLSPCRLFPGYLAASQQVKPMSKFRICIFTSAWTPSRDLRHFLWRLSTDLPEVEVAGILYETQRPPLWQCQKASWLEIQLRHLSNPHFIRYGMHRTAGFIRKQLRAPLRHLLHFTHGTDGS